MSQPLSPPEWVATQTELHALVRELSKQPSVAVDTESNSLYAYHEQVCLIQFSTSETDYLVDPLALDDLTVLGEVFANPKIEKILHAAEYDLICLKRDFDFSVTNIFDTRWAVRVLGYARDGLDGLLVEKFDAQVNKKYQKADWGRRPLSDEQINYARLDTHYLLPLKDMLQAELEEKGLLQLACEDFERACDVEIPAAKPVLWERMANHHNFTPRELTILKELYECREQIAEELDRPSFKVMGDKQLFDIARLTPQYLDELFGLGLSNRQVMRWGKAVLRAVERGQTAPLVRPQQPERPDDAYLSRLDALKTWRKNLARQMQVESDVVLPRQLMEMIAENAPHGMTELSDLLAGSPWRMERFGPQILNAVKGKR
ncbi:MAG: ribonuclease D [Anaerolineales bacterium]|nr:ribonuclease D [Anaerolineales bacterium]